MKNIRITDEIESVVTAIEYAVRNHESGEYPDFLIISQYKVACKSLLDSIREQED